MSSKQKLFLNTCVLAPFLPIPWAPKKLYRVTLKEYFRVIEIYRLASLLVQEFFSLCVHVNFLKNIPGTWGYLTRTYHAVILKGPVFQHFKEKVKCKSFKTTVLWAMLTWVRTEKMHIDFLVQSSLTIAFTSIVAFSVHAVVPII